jgi:hypothetical protein
MVLVVKCWMENTDVVNDFFFLIEFNPTCINRVLTCYLFNIIKFEMNFLFFVFKK